MENTDRIFSGTDYLGLSVHPEFLQRIREGQSLYGSHYGGSRWSNTCPDVYEQGEEWLCNRFGCEAAAFVSSGSLAASFLLEISQSFDAVYFLSGNTHPANLLSPDTSVAIDHTDEIDCLPVNDGLKRALAANAINPTTLEQLDPTRLMELAALHPFTFMIDDSHGIGVTGKDGRGFSSVFRDVLPTCSADLLVVASLGKGYSLPAGVLMGPSNLIERIKNLPRWGGASPPPPAAVHALIHSEELVHRQQIVLRERIDCFLDEWDDPESLGSIRDFPVFTLPGTGYFASLKDKGFIISSFAYPDRNGKVTERVVLNSTKKEEDIKELARWIQKIKPERLP